MAKKQVKIEKAIIFSCIDTWGKNYKFVIVCDETEVKTKIDEALSILTEIEEYEVCNAYKTIA